MQFYHPSDKLLLRQDLTSFLMFKEICSSQTCKGELIILVDILWFMQGEITILVDILWFIQGEIIILVDILWFIHG
jgi:hypothetical protein